MIKRALVALALMVFGVAPAHAQTRRQAASASVLSEHHLEVLDSMTPQAQTQFLLERAINGVPGRSNSGKMRNNFD